MVYDDDDLKGGIGILGGTFDPVHLGHTLLAKSVIEHYGLSRVYFIPVYKNPLRMHEQPVAEPEDRFVMAHLATLEDPRMIVTGVEIERGRELPGPSYTVATLERYKAKYPKLPLVLIVGADNVAFHNWHRARDFPDLIARIAVVSRPDYETSMKRSFDNLQAKLPGLAEIIDILPILEMPVSATEIRRSLSQNKVPSDSLHPLVERYIKKYGLYGMDR